MLELWGFFYVLAVINSAAMNTGVFVYLFKLVVLDILMRAILSGVNWFLIVGLIFIYLLTEHLLVCLLAICISSLEKYLIRSSAHFSDCIVCSVDVII